MIVYRKANLIKLMKEGHYDVILQGCNCFCSMTDGFAKQVADNFPQALEVDKATGAGNAEKLGSFSEARIYYNDHVFYIVNLYTQFHYAGQDIEEVQIFDYEAFEQCLELVAQKYKKLKIAMPLIGTGHAMGDADRIIAIIKKKLSACRVDIVIHCDWNIPEEYNTLKNRLMLGWRRMWK